MLTVSVGATGSSLLPVLDEAAELLRRSHRSVGYDLRFGAVFMLCVRGMCRGGI